MGAAGLLPGYLETDLSLHKTLSGFSFLWQNKTMPRWLPPLIAIILGIALGLIYGWTIDPVQFVDTTPDSLRADYRSDYVLMIAEAYHANQDAGIAARRLAVFGSDAPATIAAQALQTGQASGYAPSDISLLQELTRAMQAYQPIPAPGNSP